MELLCSINNCQTTKGLPLSDVNIEQGQFLVTDACSKGQGKSAEVYICAAIRMWLKLDKYDNKRTLEVQIVRMTKFYDCSGV